MAPARAQIDNTPPSPLLRSIGVGAPAYASVISEACALYGSRVHTLDGRVLTDFVNGAGEVLLGWSDRAVEAAVDAGRNPELLEIEAAERLAALIPSAETVSFRPSFESALADALLAAKTLTGRDGAYFFDPDLTASGGSQELGLRLQPLSEVLAALVIRPMEASRAFLERARSLTRRAGVLLVFDERRSAFRRHRGGAQAATGVSPDLTLIGGSMANGRRIAAIAGALEPVQAAPRSDATLPAASLAAACATLDKVERLDPAGVLRVVGSEITAEVEARLKASGAAAWFTIGGDPAWTTLAARADTEADADALDAMLAAGLYDHGVLSYGDHAPSLANGPDDVERLLAAYDAVLPTVTCKALSGAFAPAAARSRP